jgi:hypothetical protein
MTFATHVPSWPSDTDNRKSPHAQDAEATIHPWRDGFLGELLNVGIRRKHRNSCDKGGAHEEDNCPSRNDALRYVMQRAGQSAGCDQRQCKSDCQDKTHFIRSYPDSHLCCIFRPFSCAKSGPTGFASMIRPSIHPPQR